MYFKVFNLFVALWIVGRGRWKLITVDANDAILSLQGFQGVATKLAKVELVFSGLYPFKYSIQCGLHEF
jgi:hypothetical protein